MPQRLAARAALAALQTPPDPGKDDDDEYEEENDDDDEYEEESATKSHTKKRSPAERPNAKQVRAPTKARSGSAARRRGLCGVDCVWRACPAAEHAVQALVPGCAA